MSNGDPAPARMTYVEVDTSTEAERQMVATSEENVVLGGGRGLLDPSDRMYLAEQTQLKLQAQSKEQLERQAALQTFRTTALQMQAHKTAITLPKISSKKAFQQPDTEKKAMMVIKAKKRRTKTSEKKTSTKKSRLHNAAGGNEKTQPTAKSMPAHAQDNVRKGNVTSTPVPHTMTSATSLLLQEYSSSSDDEEGNVSLV